VWTARKSPSAAWTRAVSAATGDASSRVTPADAPKKTKMSAGPCQPMMSHVWVVYHTTLKSDVETETKTSARHADHLDGQTQRKSQLGRPLAGRPRRPRGI